MKSLFALVITLLLTSVSASLHAQPYDQSIGVRVGSANGVSYQKFLGRSHNALEAMLVYRRGGARLIGMMEHHIELGRRTDTYLYVGIGGHVGANGVLHTDEFNKTVYGVDFMAGLQYVFPYSPIAVSVDLKPMIELNGGMVFSGNNLGASLRITLD